MLLHGLVDTRAISLVHFIELIDEAETSVGQDKGTTLESPLASDRVFVDTSSQTNSTSTLTSCVNDTREKLLHVLEELRFGGTWVTE